MRAIDGRKADGALLSVSYLDTTYCIVSDGSDQHVFVTIFFFGTSNTRAILILSNGCQFFSCSNLSKATEHHLVFDT